MPATIATAVVDVPPRIPAHPAPPPLAQGCPPQGALPGEGISEHLARRRHNAPTTTMMALASWFREPQGRFCLHPDAQEGGP